MLFSVSATPSLPSSSVAQNCFAVSPTFPLFQILEQRAAFSMSLFLIWMPISWRTFHDLLVAGGAVPRFPLRQRRPCRANLLLFLIWLRPLAVSKVVSRGKIAIVRAIGLSALTIILGRASFAANFVSTASFRPRKLSSGIDMGGVLLHRCSPRAS